MVSCAAIDERMCAAGVVANHATDTAAVGGGGLRTEEETVRLEGFVQLIAHHAGLYPCPAFLRVNLDYVVKVATYVNDNTVTYHLTGDACSAGTRNEVGVPAADFVYEFNYVVVRLREGNGEREFAVD